jgi:hypothetical protein
MLNHVHYVDSGRGGRRPLTFSRYAGLGSHRYPVGFSGDTIATWASLAFQPFFTATAANVGYFWWSHDIGGHLGGAKDPELATRWYQFGAFSPINRLHSSNSPFNSKEPWRFGVEAERVMARYLRLRHQLVPYVYSASWVAHTDGVALVRPMYHDHPEADDAYGVPNQYMFGPDLLVAPITSPADPESRLAAVTAWLPEGVWFDVFTGRRYDGGRTLVLHRPLELMPVLARAGSVVPQLADPMSDVSVIPDALLLQVFPSAAGNTELYEDDGRGAPSVAQRHQTTIELEWDGDDAVLSIGPPTGPGVRTERSITLELVGVTSVGQVLLRAGGRVSDITGMTATPVAVRVELGRLDLTHGVAVTLRGIRVRDDDVPAAAFALVDRAEIAYTAKERALAAVTTLTGPALVAELHALDLPGNLYGALLELVSARR